jgi:hypothetical protein
VANQHIFISTKLLRVMQIIANVRLWFLPFPPQQLCFGDTGSLAVSYVQICKFWWIRQLMTQKWRWSTSVCLMAHDSCLGLMVVWACLSTYLCRVYWLEITEYTAINNQHRFDLMYLILQICCIWSCWEAECFVQLNEVRLDCPAANVTDINWIGQIIRVEISSKFDITHLCPKLE